MDWRGGGLYINDLGTSDGPYARVLSSLIYPAPDIVSVVRYLHQRQPSRGRRLSILLRPYHLARRGQPHAHNSPSLTPLQMTIGAVTIRLSFKFPDPAPVSDAAAEKKAERHKEGRQQFVDDFVSGV